MVLKGHLLYSTTVIVSINLIILHSPLKEQSACYDLKPKSDIGTIFVFYSYVFNLFRLIRSGWILGSVACSFLKQNHAWNMVVSVMSQYVLLTEGTHAGGHKKQD